MRYDGVCLRIGVHLVSTPNLTCNTLLSLLCPSPGPLARRHMQLERLALGRQTEPWSRSVFAIVCYSQKDIFPRSALVLQLQDRGFLRSLENRR